MLNNLTWSPKEKKVAKKAFDDALRRECQDIFAYIQKSAQKLKEPEDIWKLHDYLERRRQDIDNKYDYRYSQLIFVFSRLLHEGWLKKEDLEGLSEDKIKKIEFIAGGVD